MTVLTTSYVHGTLNAYIRHGCRCGRCQDAKQTDNAAWRTRRNPADTPHGTRSGYAAWGCRCDTCREAQRLYVADYRARRRAAS
jgi:hypothetical protein